MRRSNKYRKQALAVISVIFIGAAFFGYHSRETHESREQREATAVAPDSATSAVQSGESPAAVVTGKSASAVEANWRKFQEKFGSNLESAFTKDHRLVRVRAGEELGSPADRFSTGNKDAALARGQEILQQAGELLGLKADYPVQARAVRSDEVSSQIEWVQTYHGVSIEPFGRVTLQLDAEGGLHGLYSNYISDPVIVNAPALDDSAARTMAFSHMNFQPDRPLESGPSPKGI